MNRSWILAGALSLAAPVFAAACGDDDSTSKKVDSAATRVSSAAQTAGTKAAEGATAARSAVAGIGAAAAQTATAFTNASNDRVEMQLISQNNSGISGKATLTSEGPGKTKVVLDLQGDGVKDEPRPAHIHDGSCSNLDPAPEYPLSDVKDGKSETVVDAALNDLRNGDYAINVHKSAAEATTYIACGDIPKR